jgi:ABC-type branched-subunit amino acid transport system substrate-binding protein
MESMREVGMNVPDSTAALGYDAVTVCVLALARAEEPTRQGLRDALSTLSDLPLITGKTTITAEGEAIKSVYIMKVVREGNKLSAVETERLDP